MGAIDADAHVIETVQTWSYLDGDERRYTPQLMTQSFGAELLSNEGTAVRDFWVIEGRAHGKDRNVGTNTSKESREMLSVAARLAHMDELDIEVQVLYPTLFLRPIVQDAERERALCKSYNRWMGELWRQGQGRLRWVVKPPLQYLEKQPAVVRREFNLPEGTTVRRLDIAGNGMIWYVNSALGRLGRLDPKTGQYKEWPSPSGPKSHPYAIAVVDGIVWYNESAQRPDTLVRFDPASEKFQSWPIPSGNLYGGILRHMRPTRDGNLLIHQTSTNRIYEVNVKPGAQGVAN